MRTKTFSMLIALMVITILAACGDDEQNEYAVDMDQIHASLPGSWTIDEAVGEQVSEEIENLNRALLNGTVDFDQETFQVTDNQGNKLYSGTYKLRRYYIALLRPGNLKDTLHLRNLDRNTYRMLKWRYKVNNDSYANYTINKK